MVHHTAATRSAEGSSRTIAFRTVRPRLSPVTENPSTTRCQSRIQVNPDATNCNVSRHCSGRDCWSANIPTSIRSEHRVPPRPSEFKRFTSQTPDLPAREAGHLRIAHATFLGHEHELSTLAGSGIGLQHRHAVTLRRTGGAPAPPFFPSDLIPLERAISVSRSRRPIVTLIALFAPSFAATQQAPPAHDSRVAQIAEAGHAKNIEH